MSNYIVAATASTGRVDNPAYLVPQQNTTQGMQARPALHALRRVTSRHPGMGGIPCL